MTPPRCFCVHACDNVGTLLSDAAAGPVHVFGAVGESEIQTLQPTKLGHKLALKPIATGEPVVKYGVRIGLATSDIAIGDWVHLHNCRSCFDARSSSLDVETGATTDVIYE